MISCFEANSNSSPNPPHLYPVRESTQERWSLPTKGEPKDGAFPFHSPRARPPSADVCHTRCLPLSPMLQDKQMGFSRTKSKLRSFPCLLLWRTVKQVSPPEELFFPHIAVALCVSCTCAALVFKARCFRYSSLRCRSLKSGLPKVGVLRLCFPGRSSKF